MSSDWSSKIRRRAGRAVAAAAIGAAVGAGCVSLPRPPAARTPVERRGRHLLRIATGCGCHGPNFAGWREGGPDLLPRSAPYGERFVGPFGTVPASNITPDPETGIGRWSDAEIVRAIRDGIRPDGTRLHPLMPYPAFHGMAESDLTALGAYLRRLRPVRNRIPARRLTGDLPDTPPRPPAPPRPPESGIALGKYLVENVSLCLDCHAPHGPGGVQPEIPAVGNLVHLGPSETVVAPNLTPDPQTGLGAWKRSEIARYLRTGSRPDGGLAQSVMAGLIFTSFSHFTHEEADAVAAYLKSLRPIRNRVEGGP
jgi:mono/diheme cytochrome c family protein